MKINVPYAIMFNFQVMRNEEVDKIISVIGEEVSGFNVMRLFVLPAPS